MRKTSLFAFVSTATLALAACSGEPERPVEPSTEEIAPEPMPEPEPMPPIEPMPIETPTPTPTPEPLAEDEQMLEDADATGMTSRVDRGDTTGEEEAVPVEE